MPSTSPNDPIAAATPPAALPAPAEAPAEAVLLLDADLACFRPGARESGSSTIRRGRIPLERGAEQLRAVAELVGRGRGPLRIALGAGWCSTALVDLPPMSRADLGTVLARRAAALAAVEPGDVRFSARRLGPSPNLESEGREQRYLLAATSRARLEPLLLELARRGRRVTSVWPARLARLSDSVASLGGVARDGRGVIVLHVESEAVVVNLVSGELVLSQTVLEGNFERVPTLPLAVLQELRNLDAFHRKARRGERVAAVLVAGMETARAGLFENSLRATLPGASARFVTRADRGDTEDDGAERFDFLVASAGSDGPFSLNLRAPVPLGRMERLVLATALGVGIIGLASLAASRLDSRSLETQSRLALAEARAVRLAELESADGRAEQALVELVGEVERLAAIGAVGVEPGATLSRIGQALPPGVLLGSLSIETAEGGGEVHLVGRVSPDPLRGLSALEQLRERLEALPELADVRVTPDSELDREGQDRLPGLGFEARAALELSGS